MESAAFIHQKCSFGPKIGIVLGSGLGGFSKEVENPVTISYDEIPGFPISTNTAHEGKMYIGKLENKDVIILSGRFHFYEGWGMEDAAYYVRVFKLLGVEKLIVTNAAGCINTDFEEGSLMCVADHINFTGLSPCRGANDSRFGERFFDMSEAYSRRLRALAHDCADKLQITLHDGVYALMTGPQYETPAEIRALRLLGADAVGMSTVPEVIEAAHCGIETLCISCLTNYAAGISKTPLSDEEVVKTAAQTSVKFQALLKEVIKNID